MTVGTVISFVGLWVSTSRVTTSGRGGCEVITQAPPQYSGISSAGHSPCVKYFFEVPKVMSSAQYSHHGPCRSGTRMKSCARWVMPLAVPVVPPE